MTDTDNDRYPGLVGAKILLVDDVSEWIEILRETLDRCMCELHACGTGEEAVKCLLRAKVQGNPFDLIISDLMMPDMNGFRMLRQIRSTPVLRNIPAIVTTVESGPEDVRFCNECGVSAYLLKPYKRERLLEEAEKAVVLARGERS